ncbi:Diphthamide biosynthesis protein 1, partial [Lobosporangium transversale]
MDSVKTQPIEASAEPAPSEVVEALELTPSGKPKKRFVGKARKQQQQQQAANDSSDLTIEDSVVAIRDASKSAGSSRSRVANQVPDEILNDTKLNLAIEQLPSNYGFEIHKTVWSVRKAGAKK